MSSETAPSPAPPKGASGETEPETPLSSQAPRDKSIGGVGEPSEPSAVAVGGTKAQPSESSPEEAGTAEASAPEKAVLWKMRPCLDGLTDELTLRLFMELDFGSLAAVKRVTRRFHRIASDPCILGRVSIVQWTEGKEKGFVAPWSSHDGARDGASRFHTDHLGSIRLPEDEEEKARKFLLILERLLEKGASVVSLQLPRFYRGGVARDLPALLAKHKVRLEALACSSGSSLEALACGYNAGVFDFLVTLLRSQPGIAHLFLADDLIVEGFTEFLPSLRHMSLLCRPAQQNVRLAELAPRLRSLVLTPADMGYLEWDVAAKVPKETLLVHAVGKVYRGRMVEHVAFAVEDFQREERGRRFLLNGAPWDPWDEVRHHFPQPTNHWPTVLRFLHDHWAKH